MKDFCFGNNLYDFICDKCFIRAIETKKRKIPLINQQDSKITVKFQKYVTAKDFSSYFGALQKLFSEIRITSVTINIEDTIYMNQFCISKILLTLFQLKDKEIIFILPNDSSNHKMLRFFYNLGVLDTIFQMENVKKIINNNEVSIYTDIYDFKNCYDKAIFPYKIFSIKKQNDDNMKYVEEFINEILLETKKYFELSNKIYNYDKISERLYLYLYEIIENIFEHAYDDGSYITFSVAISNNYLPPYMKNKNNTKKFEKRIIRLEEEVPHSVYGDVQDRFFGGFNLFVDDIGKNMAKSYQGHYLNRYKEIFIVGTKNRPSNKTATNGLKLIADQVANNNDILWLHDDKYWVNCAFWENNTIVNLDESSKEDNSTRCEDEKKFYTHLPIKGVTYDIKINLAKNSNEKKKAYEVYGEKMRFNLLEIHNIYDKSKEESNDNNILNIDLLDSRNTTASFREMLNNNYKYLIFRNRAVRKNKQIQELENRVLTPITNSTFEELIIYDLNQTTLFQIRAVIETEKISEYLLKNNFKKVILISEECWIFVLEFTGKVFSINKRFATKYIEDNKQRLLSFFESMASNGNQIINYYLNSNINEFLITGDIEWDNLRINHYFNIEKMLKNRAYFDIVFKEILRISGMLSDNKKIVFIENFMEDLFAAHVNEYKEEAIQKIFFGSILLTKNTEKVFTQNDDQKFYLFKHKDSNEIGDNYLFIFDYPVKNLNENNDKYRRLKNSNKLEKYFSDSDEYKLYTSDSYQVLVKKINIKIGYLNTGLIDLVKNQQLFNAFTGFVIEIINIEIEKHKQVAVNISTEFANYFEAICDFNAKIELENVLEQKFSREINKTVLLNDKYGESKFCLNILGNINMIELLSLKKNNSDQIIITVSNNIKFDSVFDKIVDIGYMPFIPLYISLENNNIDKNNIDYFVAFSKSLNSTFRRALEIYILGGALKFNDDLSIQLFTDLDEISRNLPEKNNEILIDIIKSCICENLVIYENKDIYSVMYSSFISLIRMQHSITTQNRIENSKTIKNIINNYIKVGSGLTDSIILFFQIVIMYFADVSYTDFVDLLKNENLFKELRNKNCNLVIIIIAKICRNFNLITIERQLNEIFVSNDIYLYYNMLYQNLFNEHGSIHDSILGQFSKYILESNDLVTKERFEELKIVLNECFSLLKLTKPYNESDEVIKEVEKELKTYELNFKSYLTQLHSLIEKTTDIAKSRFIIIEKDDYENGCRKFIDKIISKRLEKAIINGSEYQLKKEFILVVIDLNDDKISKNQNAVYYNDIYIIEELAYLLDNSIVNSKGLEFSIKNNEDKKNNVWIICKLDNSKITIELINAINEPYQGIEDKINAKKRIGKTHLEKFNIHVSYQNNSDLVIDNDIKIINTKIEIPYFN